MSYNPYQILSLLRGSLVLSGPSRNTAGLNIMCGRTKQLICRETKRATTNQKLHTQSSRRNASTGVSLVWGKFGIVFFGELFLKQR